MTTQVHFVLLPAKFYHPGYQIALKKFTNPKNHSQTSIECTKVHIKHNMYNFSVAHQVVLFHGVFEAGDTLQQAIVSGIGVSIRKMSWKVSEG